MAIFPGELELAGFIEIMEVVVTTGAIRCAKLQPNYKPNSVPTLDQQHQITEGEL